MKCTNLHRYRRRNIGSKTKPFLVYHCIDCPSYTRPEMFVGRNARCFYGCGNEFKILPKHKKMAKVKCDDCMKNVVKDDSIDKLMEMLGVK